MTADDPSAESPAPPTVRLADLLKRRGMVGTGGEAKIRIQAGEVLVNGEVETRRRKQLSLGDRVSLGEVSAEVIASDISPSAD